MAKRPPSGGRASTILLLLLAPLASLYTCAHAEAASGGPDAYGYTWLDSTEPDGPVFNYELDKGAASVSLKDDSVSPPIELGFTFNFYGTDYDRLSIHSNGGLGFSESGSLGPTPDCGNLNTSLEVAMLLPYWIDLDPSSTPFSAGIYAWTGGTAPNRVFVVEWYEVPLYSGLGVSGELQFEVKLFETSNIIEIHWEDLDLQGSSLDEGLGAAVGLSQGSDGFFVISCDSSGVAQSESAVRILPPSDCLDEDTDGVTTCDGDCNDDDRDIYPGAEEVCDGKDNDCSDGVPEDELDLDGDDSLACDGDCDDDDPELNGLDADDDGIDSCNGDCDDEDASLSPEDRDSDGESGCDGDCDDSDPELNVEDSDQDGNTTCDGDCDDEDPSVLEGAAELCDGKDNDCDGSVDENPNCESTGGGQDESSAIPYGCILDCSQGGPARPGGLALVALLVAGFSLRRRGREARL